MVAGSITGPRNVRNRETITFTITATNVGDETAEEVVILGGVPDWFDFVILDCLTGTPDIFPTCSYGDLEPGDSVSMTLTLRANMGNKQERHLGESAFARVANDVNPVNDFTEYRVTITGPCRGCPNK